MDLNRTCPTCTHALTFDGPRITREWAGGQWRCQVMLTWVCDSSSACTGRCSEPYGEPWFESEDPATWVNEARKCQEVMHELGF